MSSNRIAMYLANSESILEHKNAGAFELTEEDAHALADMCKELSDELIPILNKHKRALGMAVVSNLLKNMVGRTCDGGLERADTSIDPGGVRAVAAAVREAAEELENFCFNLSFAEYSLEKEGRE